MTDKYNKMKKSELWVLVKEHKSYKFDKITWKTPMKDMI